MQVKKCTRCFKVKQLDKFAKNTRNKTDGRQPKCKDCNKEYYLANQERVISRVRGHYKENNKEILERRSKLRERPEAKKKKAKQDKAYYLNNKEAISERYKAWSKVNRARLNEIWKSWYYNNLDHARKMGLAQAHKRRNWARRNGNNTLTWKQIEILFNRQPYCEYCNKSEVKLTLDHIVPISKGGQNCISNVTIACESCNFSKGNKLLEEWLPAHKSLRLKEL